MSQLEIRNVQMHFGKKQVLHDINLTFEANKIYGLLGRNGAGKSTLLNIINDRMIPSDGHVLLDNQIMRESDALLGQAFLMNEDMLFPRNMKVKQAFKLGKALYGDFDQVLCDKLVSQFKLDMKSKIAKLSTGYKSIFKLILALCLPVSFVFLDEPVLGLDANHRDLFYRTLIDTFTERPRTFIIATHLIEEIADIIENVVIIRDGQVIEDTTTEDLLGRGYTIAGPKAEVASYVAGLNVIGQDSLGGLVSVYILGELSDRPIPDQVTVDKIDLQKLFVNLTNEGEFVR